MPSLFRLGMKPQVHMRGSGVDLAFHAEGTPQSPNCVETSVPER